MPEQFPDLLTIIENVKKWGNGSYEDERVDEEQVEKKGFKIDVARQMPLLKVGIGHEKQAPGRNQRVQQRPGGYHKNDSGSIRSVHFRVVGQDIPGERESMDSPCYTAQENLRNQITVADADQNRVQTEKFSGKEVPKFVEDERDHVTPKETKRCDDRTRMGRKAVKDLNRSLLKSARAD